MKSPHTEHQESLFWKSEVLTRYPVVQLPTQVSRATSGYWNCLSVWKHVFSAVVPLGGEILLCHFIHMDPCLTKFRVFNTERSKISFEKKKKPHTVPCPPNFSGPMVVYRDVGILSDIFWGRINLCKQSEGPRGHNEEWSSHLQRLHTVFVFTFYCHSNLWTLADGIGTLKLPQNYVEGNRGACFKSS